MLKCFFVTMLLGYAASSLGLPLASQYALVIEEANGKVLLAKNADVEVPIASLTKLMTAMVVLDAKPDMDEAIPIAEPSVLTKKRCKPRLPVGAMLPRRTVLGLALMSSDNNAAVSLAYAYPGGIAAFNVAVADKLAALGMRHTHLEEPTGLSNANRSTASDLARMAAAAATYPEIVRITTSSSDTVDVEGRSLQLHNTNHLVGQLGWDILLSKTGFTTPAGRCLIMRMQAAGQTVIVVLLKANASSERLRDALNVRRYLVGVQALRSPGRRVSSHAANDTSASILVNARLDAKPSS
ncbi:MAG: serine hydrolase [Sterolibacterium sp.]